MFCELIVHSLNSSSPQQLICVERDKKAPYLWEQPNRIVRCRAFLVWQSEDMFVYKPREHDSLPRLKSKVCVAVEFLVIWKNWKIEIGQKLEWWMNCSKYSQIKWDLTWEQEIGCLVTVVLLVARKPLRARWRCKKLACCIVTSCKDFPEIVPATKEANI